MHFALLILGSIEISSVLSIKLWILLEIQNFDRDQNEYRNKKIAFLIFTQLLLYSRIFREIKYVRLQTLHVNWYRYCSRRSPRIVLKKIVYFSFPYRKICGKYKRYEKYIRKNAKSSHLNNVSEYMRTWVKINCVDPRLSTIENSLKTVQNVSR